MRCLVTAALAVALLAAPSPAHATDLQDLADAIESVHDIPRYADADDLWILTVWTTACDRLDDGASMRTVLRFKTSSMRRLIRIGVGAMCPESW